MKKIEFVCSANQGRSPLAELIGRNRLQDNGAVGYDTSSSGTMLQQVLDWEKGADFPFGVAAWAVLNATKRGEIYTELERQSLTPSLTQLESLPLTAEPNGFSPEQIRQVQSLAHKAFHIYEGNEVAYRAEAVKKFGLTGILKTSRDQIVPREDTILVLGMGKDNLAVINKLYNGFPNQPIVDTLKDFALDGKGLKFENAYGKDLAAYLVMAEEIRDYTQKSIDRALSIG